MRTPSVVLMSSVLILGSSIATAGQEGGPDTVFRGSTETEYFVGSQECTSRATGVEVTDLLPSGVTYVSRTLTQGTYSSGTGVWVVGSVASGGSATLTLTATVDAGTGGSTIVNTASVTASDQGDDIPGHDSDSASLTVQILDLAVTKTVDDNFPNEGDTIVYTVLLDNNGPDAGTNVVVTDALPSGLTYVSSIATSGSTTVGPIAASPVKATLASALRPVLATSSSASLDSSLLTEAKAATAAPDSL